MYRVRLIGACRKRGERPARDGRAGVSGAGVVTPWTAVECIKRSDRGTAARPAERPAVDGRAGVSGARGDPPWTAGAMYRVRLIGACRKRGERPAMDGRAGASGADGVTSWTAAPRVQCRRSRHCRAACRTPGHGMAGPGSPEPAALRHGCQGHISNALIAPLPRGLPTPSWPNGVQTVRAPPALTLIPNPASRPGPRPRDPGVTATARMLAARSHAT